MDYQVKSDLRQRDVVAFYKERDALRDGIAGVTPESLVNALALFHQEITKLKPSPEQYRDLAVRFIDGFTQARKNVELTGPIGNDVLLKAAVNAGLFELNGTVVTFDVDDLKPWQATQLVQAVNKAIVEAFKIDPK